MIKKLIILVLVAAVSSHEGKKHRERIEDPLTALDRHLTHSLAYHFLWPWTQMIRATSPFIITESLEEPQISSDSEMFRVSMFVKKFKPDELRVRVKNGQVKVEGKHKENGDEKMYLANHFMQRFALPPGSKDEEVKAILNEKGVLVISAPRHEVPPPPPEREVPIEVLIPEKVEATSEKIKTSSEVIDVSPQRETSEKLNIESIQSSSATPLEQLDLEATTHIGKIRKKELKPTKTAKDNEVNKNIDMNGLDYALVEPEE